MKKKILISAAFLFCATEYSFASGNNPSENFEEENLPPKFFKQPSVSKNNFAKNLKFFENRDLTDNNNVKPFPKNAPEKKPLVKKPIKKFENTSLNIQPKKVPGEIVKLNPVKKNSSPLKISSNRDVTDNNIVKPSLGVSPKKNLLVKKPIKKVVKNYQPVVYTLDKLPKFVVGKIMENLDSKSFAKFASISKFFSLQAKDYFNGLIGDGSDSEHVKNFLFTAKEAFSKLKQTKDQKMADLLSSDSEQFCFFNRIFEEKAFEDKNFKFLLETAVQFPFLTGEEKESQKAGSRRFGHRIKEFGFYAPFFNAPTGQKLSEEKLKTLFQHYCFSSLITTKNRDLYGGDFIMFPLVFNIFLEKGISIDTCELSQGFTPLTKIVSGGDNLSNMEFLLKKGANINQKDQGSFYAINPLEHACNRYVTYGSYPNKYELCLSIVDLLLKNGANMREKIVGDLSNKDITIIGYIQQLKHEKHDRIKKLFEKHNI